MDLYVSESIHDCRETKEECGLDVLELDHVGTLIFEFIREPQLLEVHVFRTEHYTGTVTESEGESPSIKQN
jgi:8-oxo-dGTP diphosphatase/2-hydroxy-dATP diphosphatase